MSTDAQAKAYTEFDYKDAQGIEIRAYVWLPGPVGSFDDTDVIASASTMRPTSRCVNSKEPTTT